MMNIIKRARELGKLRKGATGRFGKISVVPLSGNSGTLYAVECIMHAEDAHLFAAAYEMAELLEKLADELERAYKDIEELM